MACRVGRCWPLIGLVTPVFAEHVVAGTRPVARTSAEYRLGWGEDAAR
ncbi:hypothetical protein FHR81_002816 [Actinoalloteichus hoggarensis]|nr:hypothetical protein [Actinoalloteichus hoggarensis]